MESPRRQRGRSASSEGFGFRAVRPLFQVRHERTAARVEVIARHLFEIVPAAEELRHAVVRDLCWLCAYLGEAIEAAGEEGADLTPARRALSAFVADKAPGQHETWLDVALDAEPLRWAFRAHLPEPVGDSLNAVLQLVFLMGDSLAELNRYWEE